MGDNRVGRVVWAELAEQTASDYARTAARIERCACLGVKADRLTKRLLPQITEWR